MANRNMLDTVRSTITQFTGNSRSRGRNSRGRGRSSTARGGLASQASGFIGGLLSGGDAKNSRGRSRGGNRSRRRR